MKAVEHEGHYIFSFTKDELRGLCVALSPCTVSYVKTKLHPGIYAVSEQDVFNTACKFFTTVSGGSDGLNLELTK